MQVGSERYRMAGGIHRIAVPGTTGSLFAAAFAVTGPDPAAALDDVGADTMVCLVTQAEIAMRHPEYGDWLESPEPHDAIHLPIEDQIVTDDDATAALVADIVDRLEQGRGVLVHCGAGYGRAGIVCISVLTACGLALDAAVDAVRAGRPAAGPQSPEQEAQIARLAPTGARLTERRRSAGR